MLTKLKQYFALLAYVIGVLCGGYCAHLQYSHKIEKLKEEATAAHITATEELAQKNSRIVDLQSELDRRHRAYSDSISDLSRRVQLSEDRANRKGSTASVTVDPDLARCRRLLSDGAGVVEQCTRVLGNTAKQCDSLIEFHK